MKHLAVRAWNYFVPFAFVYGIAAFAMTHALPAHADAAAGKADYIACAACHSVTGAEGVGPHLNGVIGRKAGSVAGFSYSSAVSQSNIVWSSANLNSYIADPQKLIPGNHMPYPGQPDAQVRTDIVAYLATLH